MGIPPSHRKLGGIFSTRLLRSSLFFFLFIYVFKHTLRLVSTVQYKTSNVRSILIISVLDEQVARTVTRSDPRGTLEDLLVPKKCVGSSQRLLHVILVSDPNAHGIFVPWFSKHLRRASHVHVVYTPALLSHAAKVQYGALTRRDFQIIMLWDFAHMSIPLIHFRQLVRFAQLKTPFVIHEDFTYESSSSNGHTPFERQSYDEFLKNSLRPWHIVVMQMSLFESVGGLLTFSSARYTCLGTRAHFEGAELWRARIGVRIASAPRTPATRSFMHQNETNFANFMQSCGLTRDEIEILKVRDFEYRDSGTTIIKVALVHEMIPLPNQGGNIRLIAILAFLLARGVDVQIFVRENMKTDTTIVIASGFRVRVWADDFKLTRFRTSALDFDCVISSMWFWNRPTDLRRWKQVPTIPILVEQILGENLHIRHVVVTDDIHASRCFQTETDKKDYCSYIRRQEESVWASFRVIKIFVSTEDMAFARSVVPEATETMTFIPYIIRPKHRLHGRTVFRSQLPFKLAYFGKSHPANVGALKTLLRAYHAEENRLNQYTELWIVGDDKWIQLKELKGRRTQKSMHVVGELEDLDTFLESVDLVLAPVTVGGTGVSSKVFKCLETNVPFVTTSFGMRGFECDAECRGMFIAENVEDVLTLGMKLLFDAELRIKAKLKMREIAQKLTIANIGKSSLFMQALFTTDDGDVSSSMRSLRNMDERAAYSALCPDKFECAQCKFTETCIRVCDLERQDVKHEPILLSVYTSLLGGTKEEPFLKHFVLDVLDQNFDIGAWEVVVASSDTNILAKFRDRIVRERTCFNSTLQNTPQRIRTVHLRRDEGLYETWDELIKNFTTGEILTNWNADDRKHSRALYAKVSLLQRLPTIDVVSSSVYTSTLANQDWLGCQRAMQGPTTGKRCEVWFSERGEYALSSFVQSDPETASLMKLPQNYPHNAPVYRRRVHDKVGYFSSEKAAIAAFGEDSAPACFDWRFWVRVASEGGRFYNVDTPLEVYYMRSDSHNRRDERSSDACIRSVLQTLSNRGLYNNAYYWRFNFAQQFKWRTKITFLIDSTSASEVNTRVESDFVTWLDENGHRVDVLDISQIPSASHAEYLSDVELSTARRRRDSRAFAVSETQVVFLGSTIFSQRKKNEPTLRNFKLSLNKLNVRVAVISSSRSARHFCAELNNCNVIDVSNKASIGLRHARTIRVGNYPGLWAKNKRLIKYLQY